jgi:hypothetical protein
MLPTRRAGSQLTSDLGLGVSVARTGARREDPPRQDGQQDREHDSAYQVGQVFVIHDVHAFITPQGEPHGLRPVCTKVVMLGNHPKGHPTGRNSPRVGPLDVR